MDRFQNLRSKGFTLMELVLVVAIIAFLAAIIFVFVGIAGKNATIAAGKEFAASIDHEFSADEAGSWNFDENTGTLTADTSGNANNGIVSTPSAWVPAVYGSGLQFTTNYALSVPADNAFNSPTFTIAFFVKPANMNAGCDGGCADQNIIAQMGQYHASGFQMGFNASGHFVFSTLEQGGTLVIVTPGVIPTSRFSHIAVSYSKGQGAIYLDGAIVATGSGTYVPTGSYSIGFGGFNGILDNFRFYTDTLLTN